jgi:hypothetical protein
MLGCDCSNIRDGPGALLVNEIISILEPSVFITDLKLG